MAQHTGNRQWTMLHKQGLPDTNGIHVCKPYPQLSPLSSEQWTSREICRNHQKLFYKSKQEGQSPYTALMVYRNIPLGGSLQSPMQILQGRQACTDLPLLHAGKIQMGINHAPRPTPEILCTKDKSLSAPTHNIIVGQHVMYREPQDGRWYPATVIQQLLEKDPISSKIMRM